MHRIAATLAIASSLLLSGCGDAEKRTAVPAEQAAPAQQAKVPNKDPAASVRRGPNEFDVERVKVVYEHEGTESGTTTMWIEDYGNRVAIEADMVTKMGKFEQPRRQRAYWDGDRMYVHDLVEDNLWDSGLRMKDTEPSAFGVTRDRDLERVGYKRIGEKTIAGKPCEHWRNAALNFEACRWQRVDLMSVNGALSDMTGGVRLAKTAVEVVEGEGIPDEFRKLAK